MLERAAEALDSHTLVARMILVPAPGQRLADHPLGFPVYGSGIKKIDPARQAFANDLHTTGGVAARHVHEIMRSAQADLAYLQPGSTETTMVHVLTPLTPPLSPESRGNPGTPPPRRRAGRALR